MKKEKEIVEPEYTYITSFGRDLWWRMVNGEYEVHTGKPEEAKVIGSWDKAQRYLDHGGSI